MYEMKRGIFAFKAMILILKFKVNILGIQLDLYREKIDYFLIIIYKSEIN